MNENEKTIMVTKALAKMKGQKEILNQYMDNPFEDIELVSKTFTDICFAFTDADGIVSLSKLFNLKIYDWKAACCKMQRAIAEKDETIIRRLLLDAIAKLDRKILHGETYLKTGSFAIHE